MLIVYGRYNELMLINRKFATLAGLIILIPFLGIPDSWKYFLIVLLGIGVLFTSIQFVPRKKKAIRRKNEKIKINETFAENSYIEKPQERKIEVKSEMISSNENDENPNDTLGVV